MDLKESMMKSEKQATVVFFYIIARVYWSTLMRKEDADVLDLMKNLTKKSKCKYIRHENIVVVFFDIQK